MTVYEYGGAASQWAMSAVTVDGTPRIPQLTPGSVLTCWSSQVGGTRYTDLADADGNLVSEVVTATGDTVYGPGAWPVWRAPVLGLWVSADGGPRVWALSNDLPSVMQQLTDVAAASAAAATASAASAAELAASSSVTGHLADPDPHGQYHTDGRGDARYVRGDIEIAPLPPVNEGGTPLRRVRFTSTPGIDNCDIEQIQVWVGGQWRTAAWRNERGLWRGEQLDGALWDAPFTAITAYNGTGRAVLVQVRDSEGQRADAGGIDAAGRPVTSDQPWTAVTDVDPDSTGDYAVSEVVGPAALRARHDTDDVIRLEGRVTAADVTSGHTILTLPAGVLPGAMRLIAVPASTGDVVPVELMPTGRVVARATVSGPLELSFDDVTYARTVADQPTGDWTVTAAGHATPGTTSPATVTYAGVAGRLYVLLLSRSSATDPFVDVTDDGDNDWVRLEWAPQSGSAGRRVEVWWTIAGDPFTSVSATHTGGGTAYANLVEVTGHDPVDPIDQSAADFRSASLTPAALQVTPSGSGRLAIAVIAAAPNGADAITPSPGWLALDTHDSGPGVWYQLDPPASPIGVAATLDTSAGSGHAIVALNPA